MAAFYFWAEIDIRLRLKLKARLVAH